MPRWVRWFVIVAVAAVLLAGVVLALDSGGHGPARHLPGGEGTTEMREGHVPPVHDG